MCRNSLFLALALSATVLTGCHTAFDPALSDGYKWHSGKFKAPPGIDPDHLGAPYSPDQEVRLAQEFDVAVNALLDAIEEERGPLVLPVYLETRTIGVFDNPSPLVRAFDHYLRQEMVKRGYVLAASEEETRLRLFFDLSTQKIPYYYRAPEEVKLGRVIRESQLLDADETLDDLKYGPEAFLLLTLAQETTVKSMHGGTTTKDVPLRSVAGVYEITNASDIHWHNRFFKPLADMRKEGGPDLSPDLPDYDVPKGYAE